MFRLENNTLDDLLPSIYILVGFVSATSMGNSWSFVGGVLFTLAGVYLSNIRLMWRRKKLERRR